MSEYFNSAYLDMDGFIHLSRARASGVNHIRTKTYKEGQNPGHPAVCSCKFFLYIISLLESANFTQEGVQITMKLPARAFIALSSILFAALATAPTARAQSELEDAVKQFTSDNARGYLQPLITAVGANFNSGFYSTAAIGDMGLHIQLQLVGIGTLIGDAEKTFQAVPPQPYPQNAVQTATVFGGVGTVVPGPAPGLEYHFQNGQVKTSIFPVAVPQLTVGNIFGTQAAIRYVPIPSIGSFPKTTLFGIGVRHSISRYIPEIPVDLSAGIFYDKVTIGDIIDAHGFGFGGQASKSFSLVTVYGGLQYETSSLTASYTYTGPGPANNTHISVDIDGENKFRATAGVNLDLMILHLNGDINLGKVTVVSAGVGFGL